MEGEEAAVATVGLRSKNPTPTQCNPVDGVVRAHTGKEVPQERNPLWRWKAWKSYH